ncbi:MAG: caspase family protein [Alphaproteobacteria bacterium]
MKRVVLVAGLVAGHWGAVFAAADGSGGDVLRAVRNTPAGPSLRVVQAEAPEFIVPRRINTDQETIDLSGRVVGAASTRLSVDGIPAPLSADGSFRIRRTVPVGRSTLRLVAEDARGHRVEKRVLVQRTAATAAVVDFGRYHALVIGNNEYRHLPALKTAVSDAMAVGALLSGRYGFTVKPLINATRYEVVSALAGLRATLTEKDSLLIYYAGHGSLDIESDQGYWLPVDAERDNPANWLSNSTITDQIKAMRAKHVMVVADSCYSGRLTRGGETNIRTGGERDPWIARMAQRRSRTALTSGGLEPVLDAGGNKHSVFAQAFLSALQTNADVMEGSALFGQVRQPVVVNADQTPEYADIRKAGHDGGDFLFVPTGVTLATPATAQPAPVSAPPAIDNRAIELAFWQSIEKSRNPASFEAYLEQFPEGTFAPLARARLEELKQVRTAVLVPPPEPQAPIDRNKIVKDRELRDLITRYYNDLRVRRYKGVYSSNSEMTSIDNLRVLQVSGNVVTLEIKYVWTATDYTFVQRSERGIVTVERLGPSYRVLKFE